MAAMRQPRRNAALELLLNRRSHGNLAEPAPDDRELATILQAALRVPDFRGLRPYRFLVARGAGRDRLGEAMRRAAVAAAAPERTIERAPHLPLRAPMVVIAVASPKQDKHVPTFDQQLCAGSTVLTMQLAARAMGFGGIWRSGWFMYDRGFHRELGLAEHEQIVGFLYLGSPQPDANDTVSHASLPPADDLLSWL